MSEKIIITTDKGVHYFDSIEQAHNWAFEDAENYYSLDEKN